jgi:hypothetical protein
VRFKPRLRTGLAAAAGLALTVAACGDFVSSPEFQPEDPIAFRMPTTDGQLCVYNAGAGPATFTISGDPDVGTYPAGSPFTVNPMEFGECLLVWQGTGDDATTLTVTETLETGWRVTRIDLARDGQPALVHHFASPVASLSFPFTASDRAVFKVFTEPYDPPANGGDGCTPGFWRQPQHFHQWTGFAPGDSYAAVFGVARAGTLLENVNAGGGGVNALARHSVAALLNAASPDVDYDLTVAEVIAAVQAAFASGNFEATKDVFVAMNEAGCTLQ